MAARYAGNDGRAASYDHHNRGLSFVTNYDLTERWQLSGGIRREWGEEVTYAWVGGSGASYPYAYDTWKNTVEVPTYGPNWKAYTIDAHTDTVWFSLSPALGPDRSLPLRIEQTAVVGRGESFRCHLISLSFVQRY